MKPRQQGFTLLEVMIAVAIMAIGIVGALELFSGSLSLAGAAARQSEAVVLARSLVDEELWRDVLEAGERTDSRGAFEWTVVTQPIPRELVSSRENPEEFRPAPGELGLWLVQAEVRWQAPTGQKSVRLETARIGALPE